MVRVPVSKGLRHSYERLRTWRETTLRFRPSDSNGCGWASRSWRLRRCRDWRVRRLGQRHDHDDRRHGRAGLLRGRRPGDVGEAERPDGGGSRQAGEHLHRGSRRRPRAQGEPRRDDLHVRRHRQGGLFRRRRPGDVGAMSAPVGGGGGRHRETSTSPIATTTVCARSAPAGRSRRSPERALTAAALSGTAAWRRRRSCAIRTGSRWTGRETSTSPTTTTLMCARLDPGGTITTIAGTGKGGLFRGRRAERPRRSCTPHLRVGGGREGERLHRRSRGQPCAQGKPGRDDHDVRRHRRSGATPRRRRPGDVGANIAPGGAGRG